MRGMSQAQALALGGLESLPLVASLEALALGPANEATLGAAVGGKAAGLVGLMRCGLPVPPGGVLTTAALQAMLDTPPLRGAKAKGPQSIAEALRTAPLPPEVAEAIATAYRAAGSAIAAVRSSGVAEDLAGASFAGLYESHLNEAGLVAVEQAVRACWASRYAERVLSYAEAKGVELPAGGMAVVIQRLVDAQASGVMFTLDPATGREEHMRVEAVWGLGEALVGGTATPDAYVLEWEGGAIAEARPVAQATRLVRAPQGGLVAEPLPAAWRQQPVLDAAGAAELAALGRQIQAWAGRPMDVEWARHDDQWWILQARPITAIQYGGISGEWTTADFKDGGVSASVCSPFMWSLYEFIWQRSMPEYLRRMRLLTHDRPITWGRVFYGRPYWNCGEVKACLHRLPGFNERRFDADLGIEGAYEGDGVVIPTTLRTVLGALPVLRALHREYRDCLAQARAFKANFEALTAPFAVPPQQLDPATLAARFPLLLRGAYVRTESTYFRTIFNTSNAKTDFESALEAVTRRWPAQAGPPPDRLALLAGLGQVQHLAPLEDIEALAQDWAQDAELKAWLLTTPSPQRAPGLAKSFPKAWAQLDAFLAKHGHHAEAELDITRPRWAEDPSFVLARLAEAMQGRATGPKVVEVAEQAQSRQRSELERVRKALKGPLGWFRLRALEKALARVRDYAWWREELRDHSSKLYALVRQEALAAATQLVALGALRREREVWLLTWQEVEGLLAGKLKPEPFPALVEARRTKGQAFLRFANPNELGLRYKVGANQGPKRNEAGALVGVGCSTGVVEGRARVVANLQEAQAVEAGEILVAPFTDPGWTPLFPRLAGVVTECGGMLAHAAVISREFGIPAVLAVPGATQALKTGMWLRLDGQAGVVGEIPAPGGP
jgi:phosphoenolpyruvate synthase/pyruvate phosphate dikinase